MSGNNLKVPISMLGDVIAESMSLAAEDAKARAIETKTSIVVMKDGKIVEIPYTELIEQRKASA